MIPHPQKAHRGGQDAYFSSDQLLIIADGVGGWNQYGIDPSKYSRFLCKKGGQLFQENKEFYRNNPIELIAKVSQLNINEGSSTMVVATLTQKKGFNQDSTLTASPPSFILKTCYIGDSGFVIFRRSQQNPLSLQIIHSFQQQQHSFNFPYQLAMNKNQGDNPHESICHNFEVKQGDILIVGSDGFFDNIWIQDIKRQIQKIWLMGQFQQIKYNNRLKQLLSQEQFQKLKDQKLFNLSKQFAQLAIKYGQDQTYLSPFAKRALQHKLKYMGGKLDDTTVTISKLKIKKEYITQNQNQKIIEINQDQTNQQENQGDKLILL